MSHERLAQFMQACRAAMDTDPEYDTTHAAILSVFQALDQGDITAGRAVSLLGYQAAHWADEPALAALYRRAAAAIRRMQHEER